MPKHTTHVGRLAAMGLGDVLMGRVWVGLNDCGDHWVTKSGVRYNKVDGRCDYTDASRLDLRTVQLDRKMYD